MALMVPLSAFLPPLAGYRKLLKRLDRATRGGAKFSSEAGILGAARGAARIGRVRWALRCRPGLTIRAGKSNVRRKEATDVHHHVDCYDRRSHGDHGNDPHSAASTP